MMLDGKIGLITGGGAGIGWATVQAFAREGAKVAILEVNDANFPELKGNAEAEGIELLALQGDVTNKEQIDQAVDAVIGCLAGFRIPLPLRMAHNRARSAARNGGV